MSRRDGQAASGQATHVRLRSLLLLLVVVVLLAMVMLTAGGRSLGAGSVSVAVPRSLGSLLFAAFTALLVISLALGVVIVYALRPSLRRKKDDDPEWVTVRPPFSWIERLLAALVPVLLAAVIVVAVVLVVHAHSGAGANVVVGPRAGAPVASPVGAQAPPVSVGSSWGLVGLAAGGLAVAGGVIALLVLRRRVAAEADGVSAEEQARDALVGRAAALSLDDVRREHDPRRAVLAAYARMEGLFAEDGLARPSSKTPSEYLADVLRASSAPPAALHDLTLLFEEARFSPHEMSGGDRDRAISALVRISEALT